MSEPRIHLQPRRPEPEARPSRRAALLLWVIAAAGLFLSSFLDALLLPLLLKLDVQPRLLAANLTYYLPFVALPVFVLARRRRGVFEAYRPNPISPFNAIAIAVLALLGVFLVNDIAVLWCIPLQELGFNVNGSSLPIPSDPRGLTLCVLSVAVLPGVCEEFLFRGAVLSAHEREGTRHAMLVSAALFALLHGSLTGLPTQFLLGLVLAALVIYCDSIYAGLIYHTVHNATAILLEYIQQGSAAASEAPVRLLDAIGGGPGVVALILEILITGAMMLFSLRMFRLRARMNGIASRERQKLPLERGEWALLLGGVLLTALLYAKDIAAMCAA